MAEFAMGAASKLEEEVLPESEGSVDAERWVAERACMHASSLSSTVLMLGRSSGRCAQHSAVSVWILSLVEICGFEICGRIPRKALKAASTPVIPSKARRS